jgi:hypothetical protein
VRFTGRPYDESGRPTDAISLFVSFLKDPLKHDDEAGALVPVARQSTPGSINGLQQNESFSLASLRYSEWMMF